MRAYALLNAGVLWPWGYAVHHRPLAQLLVCLLQHLRVHVCIRANAILFIKC